MATRGRSNVSASEAGHEESRASRGSVAEGGSEHGAYAFQHAASTAPATGEQEAPAANDLEQGRHVHDSEAEEPVEDPHVVGNMDAAGQSVGGGPTPLAGGKHRRSARFGNEVNREAVFSLLDRQGYRCALSGRELTPSTASLDHDVALSRGGEHRLANVQILHKDVNRAKATLTNDEFIAMCRDVCRVADGRSPHNERPRPRRRQTANTTEHGTAQRGSTVAP